MFEGMTPKDRGRVAALIIREHGESFHQFFNALRRRLDRTVDRILVLSLHGVENSFLSISEALNYVVGYNELLGSGPFRKYEIIVQFSNSDRISGEFEDKAEAMRFLRYVTGGPPF